MTWQKVAVRVPNEELYISLQKWLFSYGTGWWSQRGTIIMSVDHLPRMPYSNEPDKMLCMDITTRYITFCYEDWYTKEGFTVVDIGEFINIYLPQLLNRNKWNHG